MNDIDLQSQIDQIKKRNRQVELDKAREISRTRKASIAILTYLIVVLFLFLSDNNNPWLNALVPMIGFILSTLSLNIIKTVRIKQQ